MSLESQLCHFLLVINSNLGLNSQRLATIARNGLQNHLRQIIPISSNREYGIFYW